MHGMSGERQLDELHERREMALIALTASLREAVRAMAAMDLEAVDRCSQEQHRCCQLLRETQESLSLLHSTTQVDHRLWREFESARICYGRVIESSGQWLRIWANMLQLANGGDELNVGQHSLHC